MRLLNTLLILALANGAYAFEGKYTGEYEGQTLVIKQRSKTTYVLSLRIVAEECVGEIDASADSTDGRLFAIGSMGGRACRLTLTEAEEGVSVFEGEGCLEYHGPACSFDGFYSQP